MMSEQSDATYLAPAQMTMEHRLTCRDAVIQAVEHAARLGQHVVVVDLSATQQVDASGLGVLILLQKRARERGMRTRLIGVSVELGRLLDTTRLYTLFEIQRSA